MRSGARQGVLAHHVQQLGPEVQRWCSSLKSKGLLPKPMTSMPGLFKDAAPHDLVPRKDTEPWIAEQGPGLDSKLWLGNSPTKGGIETT